jgi:DNA-binding MarR family transcriptional regulator
MDPLSRQCARDLLDVVPLAMRAIRQEMRSRRTRALSVPQFRALVYLQIHQGSTLSALTEHLGRAPATVSKMTEGMVAAGLVARHVLPADRRKLNLALTAAGRSLLTAAKRGTLARLSAAFEQVDPEERQAVGRAMTTLRELFQDRPAIRTREGEPRT